MKFLIQGKEVDLTPTERRFILCLANTPNRVVSHGTLMNVVWGTRFLESSSVKQCIYHLRQKLPKGTIISHRGFGYSLIAPNTAHTPIVHADCHLNSCAFCDGGLFGCSECGALEGANTSECPGYQVKQIVWDCIYQGGLDFKGGVWITETSPHSPSFVRPSVVT